MIGNTVVVETYYILLDLVLLPNLEEVTFKKVFAWLSHVDLSATAENDLTFMKSLADVQYILFDDFVELERKLRLRVLVREDARILRLKSFLKVVELYVVKVGRELASVELAARQCRSFECIVAPDGSTASATAVVLASAGDFADFAFRGETDVRREENEDVTALGHVMRVCREARLANKRHTS